MTNSVWQATIQNAAGDIVPGAEITVIDEGTGLNAVIFSSKAGAALTNPFNADAGGFAQFYSGPGEYRISAHDLGTGLTQTFDNWRLGDAGARDTGTATGQVLLSESAGLNNGEVNLTDGNTNLNTFGVTDSFIANGTAKSTTICRFELPISMINNPSSITVTGLFSIYRSNWTLLNVDLSNVTLDISSSNKLAIIEVVGGSMVAGESYKLFAQVGGASIKVNV